MFRWETSGSAFNAWESKLMSIIETDADGFGATITALNTEINRLGAAEKIWNGTAAIKYYNDKISPSVAAFKTSLKEFQTVIEDACNNIVNIVNEIEVANGGAGCKIAVISPSDLPTVSDPAFNESEMDYDQAQMVNIASNIKTTIVTNINTAKNNLIAQFNKLGIYDECGLENTTTSTIDNSKAEFEAGVTTVVGQIVENMNSIAAEIELAAQNSEW